MGGTAGQELRVPCLQSLCTSVTCPLDARTLPLGDDGASAAKVCDVCEMYGYARGGEVREAEGSRCGGEVRAQGLRFGPKAALLAYSAFMFVDFTMAAAAANRAKKEGVTRARKASVAPAKHTFTCGNLRVA